MYSNCFARRLETAAHQSRKQQPYGVRFKMKHAVQRSSSALDIEKSVFNNFSQDNSVNYLQYLSQDKSAHYLSTSLARQVRSLPFDIFCYAIPLCLRFHTTKCQLPGRCCRSLLRRMQQRSDRTPRRWRDESLLWRFCLHELFASV
jgi:hypothetical protein